MKTEKRSNGRINRLLHTISASVESKLTCNTKGNVTLAGFSQPLGLRHRCRAKCQSEGNREQTNVRSLPNILLLRHAKHLRPDYRDSCCLCLVSHIAVAVYGIALSDWEPLADG